MKTNRSSKRKTVFKKTTVIVVLVLVAVAAIVGGWFIWRSFFGRAADELPKAELTLSPESGNFNVNQEFDVELWVDTKGGKVPDTFAYLEFDQDVFEVVKVQPNTKDAQASDPIFERSWGPKNQKALEAVNTFKKDGKGWVVIAGMTGRMTDGESERDEAAASLGGEEEWFQGKGKLATITLKGKKNATSKVNFLEVKSAVMHTFDGELDEIGQPKEDPVNVLAVVKGGAYTIGEGGEEIPAPYDLTAKGGNKKVNLNWKWEPSSAGQGATATYDLYRAEVRHITSGVLSESGSELAGFTKIESGLADKKYLDEGVVNGRTYEYYVKAVVSKGESDESNHALATPDAEEIPVPENLVAVAGDKRVGLTWEYASQSADIKFRVYRALKDEGASGVASGFAKITEVAETRYTDTGVTNGTTYLYYVTALVSGQESGPSNIVEATPQAGGGILHADIAYNDGEGNAKYGRDNKVDYFDYAFLMNVCWGKDPSNWPDPNVDYAKMNEKGHIVVGSDGKIDYAEYAYMLNVEWGMNLNK